MATIRQRRGRPKSDGQIPISWQLDYIDPAGKRRRVAYATKRAAEAARDDILIARREGAPIGSSERRFAAAAEDYLKIAEKIGRRGRPPVQPEIAAQYRRTLRLHVLPRMADARLADITRPDVIAYRDWLVLDSGLGASTQRQAFMHFRAVLEEELHRGGIRANVWAGVALPTVAARRATRAHEVGGSAIVVPSGEEVALLLRTAAALRADPSPYLSPHKSDAPWQKYSPSEGPRGAASVRSAWQRYYPLLLTAVLTGMRQGEIRALEWAAVDLDAALLHVTASATAAGRIKPPKSAAGYRAIDLPSELVAELRLLRKTSRHSLVFPSARGAPIRKENLYHRMWLALLKYAGVRAMSFHALRHYYASRLIASGATPKEVQAALGHAKIDTTFNVYGHLFPEDRTARQGRIERIAASLLTQSAK